MSKKPQTGRVHAIPMTPRQIEALISPSVKVEMFISSRLGAESVSHETKAEHRDELQRVADAVASLEGRIS
jgi:hypothetical protein